MLVRNLRTQDYQQERLDCMKVSDDYIIGFTEGEGMFYIGIVPSRETKTGWQVIYFFKVSQNPVGEEVLLALKNRFGCGYVKKNGNLVSKDKSLAYVVRDLNGLVDSIIPFFDNKLIIKRDAFLKFKQVIQLVKDRKHFTYEGMREISAIAYSMNTQKRKVTIEQILQSYNKI